MTSSEQRRQAKRARRKLRKSKSLRRYHLRKEVKVRVSNALVRLRDEEKLAQERRSEP